MTQWNTNWTYELNLCFFHILKIGCGTNFLERILFCNQFIYGFKVVRAFSSWLNEKPCSCLYPWVQYHVLLVLSNGSYLRNYNFWQNLLRHFAVREYRTKFPKLLHVKPELESQGNQDFFVCNHMNLWKVKLRKEKEIRFHYG